MTLNPKGSQAADAHPYPEANPMLWPSGSLFANFVKCQTVIQNKEAYSRSQRSGPLIALTNPINLKVWQLFYTTPTPDCQWILHSMQYIGTGSLCDYSSRGDTSNEKARASLLIQRFPSWLIIPPQSTNPAAVQLEELWMEPALLPVPNEHRLKWKATRRSIN